MEGEPKPPVLVKATQHLFVLFALANAWWMVMVASSLFGDPDELILTGRLILLGVFLLVISVFQIANRSRYARAFTIASCLLTCFRASRRMYLLHQVSDKDFIVFFPILEVLFDIFLLVNILLFLSVAGYFAFSPQVIRYFHSGREAASFDS